MDCLEMKECWEVSSGAGFNVGFGCVAPFIGDRVRCTSSRVSEFRRRERRVQGRMCDRRGESRGR